MKRIWEVHNTGSSATGEIRENDGDAELLLNGTVITSSDATVRQALLAADTVALGLNYSAKYFGMGASKTATQNATALALGIAAINAAGGGTLILPPEQMYCDPNILLLPNITIKGVVPALGFFQNCPDLLHVQFQGTRLIGPGSGSLFVGRRTPNLTSRSAGGAIALRRTTVSALALAGTRAVQVATVGEVVADAVTIGSPLDTSVPNWPAIAVGQKIGLQLATSGRTVFYTVIGIDTVSRILTFIEPLEENVSSGSSVFDPIESDALGMIDIGHFGVQNYNTIATTGAKNTNGLAFSDFHHIHAQDMNDWLFNTINPQHSSFSRIFAYNQKRGYKFQGDNAYCAPGECWVDKCFSYMRFVGSSGADYAQRYGVFIERVDNFDATVGGGIAYQFDSIRLLHSQFNFYGNGAGDGLSTTASSATSNATQDGRLQDTIGLYSKGVAANGQVVNFTYMRDTYFDGNQNRQMKFEYSPSADVEVAHYPSRIYGVAGEYGSATVENRAGIELISSPRVRIYSQNDNLVIKADGGSNYYFFDGQLQNYAAGSTLGVGTSFMSLAQKSLIVGTAGTNYRHFGIDHANGIFGPNKQSPFVKTADTSVSANALFRAHNKRPDSSGTTLSLNADNYGEIGCTNASNAVITLAVTSTEADGGEFVIWKKSGAGSVTITPDATMSIGALGNGVSYTDMSTTLGASAHLMKSGAFWVIKGKN